jgi:hypothetical protein
MTIGLMARDLLNERTRSADALVNSSPYTDDSVDPFKKPQILNACDVDTGVKMQSMPSSDRLRAATAQLSPQSNATLRRLRTIETNPQA